MVQKLCYASKSVTDGRTDGRTHAEVGGIINRNTFSINLKNKRVCGLRTLARLEVCHSHAKGFFIHSVGKHYVYDDVIITKNASFEQMPFFSII